MMISNEKRKIPNENSISYFEKKNDEAMAKKKESKNQKQKTKKRKK